MIAQVIHTRITGIIMFSNIKYRARRKLTEEEKQLRRNYRHTPEAKRKISRASKKAIRTDKWKENISKSLEGKSYNFTEERKRTQ